ncbi:MAG: DUF5916 domain-containing protein [Pyrinomonadaceae bacterium]
MRKLLLPLAAMLLSSSALHAQSSASAQQAASATAQVETVSLANMAATDVLSKPTPTPPPSAKTGGKKEKVKSNSIPVPPEKLLPIRAARFDKPPVIDGKLDEDVWKQAVVLKDFYQTNPGDNTAPSKPTEVMIGYDSKFLYFGFHCFDEPGKVRATVAARDNVTGEDNVRVYLDTFNDQRKAYFIAWNPLGIQQDGIFTEGQGIDFSFDLVMESKGQLTSDGYIVEVAIPFKSLRYEAGKGKLWGIHIWRNIDRFNDEFDSWVPMSRDNTGTLNQAAHLTGLEGISTEHTLELIPSLTLSETGKRVAALPASALNADPTLVDNGRFVNKPLKVDPGLTLKYGITPTVTLDLAINPDFAQVEADQTVVTANQRFPIFFQEKRPFFLEGIDIFQTPLQTVHTRAIVDPDIAVKLSGKRGKNTFGLMLASDNAPGNFSEEERDDLRQCQVERLTDPRVTCDLERFIDKNAYIGVLRLKRDIGKEDSIGIVATTYNFIEKHNQLLGVDGRFKVNPTTFFTFQLLGTTSRNFFFDPNLQNDVYRTGNAFGYYYNYENNGRHFGYHLMGQGRTNYYRADVGFTRRVNTNYHDLFFRYNSEPKPKARIVSWNAFNSSRTNFDWQGRSQNIEDESQIQFNFQHQSWLGVGMVHSYERLNETQLGPSGSYSPRGTFFGGPERSTYQFTPYLFAGGNPSKRYSWNIFMLHTKNAFDLDFGAGPKFPRISPAALEAARRCELNPNDCEDVALDPGPGGELNIQASIGYQPTNELSMSLDYTKDRLVRNDTGRVAFDDNIYAFRATYQFTRFMFTRARVDYDTLSSNVRGQFLFGWTPNPGTAFYVGYNDDMNRNGFSPFTGRLEPGFRRNGRVFFIKMSYLIRKSFGG